MSEHGDLVGNPDAIVNYLAHKLSKYVDDDMIQEGRIAAWLALQSYDPVKGATQRSYVFYKVKFAIIDHIRKKAGRDLTDRSRSIHRPDSLPDDMPDRLVGFDGDYITPIIEREEAEELSEIVKDVISGLTTMDQIVVTAILRGSLQQDMAAVFDVTPSRIAQIVGKFRKQVESRMRMLEKESHAANQEVV